MAPPSGTFHSPSEEIKFDFLSLLPPELVEELLSYLTVQDLLHGVQVCRRWWQLIMGALTPWKAAAIRMGVSESLIRENCPKYHSMSALTLAALRHRKYISSSTTRAVPTLGIGNASWNRWDRYIWAGQGKVLCHQPDLVTTKPLEVEIKSVGADGTCTLLRSITHLNTDLEAAKVFALENGALMWVNWSYSRWVVCRNDGRVVSWRTRRFINPDADEGYEAQVCSQCGLIAVVASNIVIKEKKRFWKLEILKLSSSAGMKATCLLKYPDNDGDSLVNAHWQKNLILIPKQQSKKDGKGFCTNHTVAINFRYGIAFFYLPECNVSGMCDSVGVSKPKGRDEHFKKSFKLSHDKKLLGVLTTQSQHYIWRLDRKEYQISPVPHNCHTCLALGHLYSILDCRDSGVNVVVTFTGEKLLVGHYPSLKLDLPHCLWEPVDVTWLNDFYYPKSGSLYLSTLEYCVSSHGRRGHLPKDKVGKPWPPQAWYEVVSIIASKRLAK